MQFEWVRKSLLRVVIVFFLFQLTYNAFLLQSDNGNSDLYLRIGDVPDWSNGVHDCQSASSESVEYCELTWDGDGSPGQKVYALVNGVDATADGMFRR